MRIGLLEDDLSQIELISLWASEAGDQLQSYTTGKSFREAMYTENFDLLVLDWHLPDTTGIEELNQSFEDLSSSLMSFQALQASTLVGREVLRPVEQHLRHLEPLRSRQYIVITQ